jgi:flagellar FliL protein
MTTTQDRAVNTQGTLTGVNAGSKDSAGDTGKVGKKAKKRGRKRLVIGLLILAVVGAAAYKFVLAPVAPTKAAAIAKAAAPVPLPGVLVTTDAVTVNLADGHYLRISVAMQFTSKVSAAKPPDPAAALDQMINYLTGMSADVLNTSAGLASAKSALTARISSAYPKDPLLQLFVTSYVIQ